MFFNIALYLSLAVFIVGSIYRISTWFRRKIGLAGQDISAAARFGASVKGILGVIFSSKILSLIFLSKTFPNVHMNNRHIPPPKVNLL
jgi:nitrate reductase gamma subunit